MTIAPNMRVELIEESGAFQSIHLKTATIYLAEARLEAVSWDLRIAVRRGSVSYLELRMIEKDAAYDRRSKSGPKNMSAFSGGEWGRFPTGLRSSMPRTTGFLESGWAMRTKRAWVERNICLSGGASAHTWTSRRGSV